MGFPVLNEHPTSPNLADNFGNCPVLLDHWTLHVHKAYKTKHLKRWMKSWDLVMAGLTVPRIWTGIPTTMSQMYTSLGEIASCLASQPNWLRLKGSEYIMHHCIRLHSKWCFCMFLYVLLLFSPPGHHHQRLPLHIHHECNHYIGTCPRLPWQLETGNLDQAELGKF